MATSEQANATPINRANLPDNLKAQDPHEALGLESQGSLVKSMGLALIITVVLVATFTAGPYALAKAFRKSDAQPQNPTAKKPEQKKKQDNKTTDKTKTTASENPTKTTSTGDPKQPSIDKGTLNKLGIGETKTGAPTYDPLTNQSRTDILDELEDK